MVSGTQCPAWSDWLKEWSESRAAAPKGRCPVGHRGDFPDVHLSFRPSVHLSICTLALINVKFPLNNMENSP